MDPLPLPANSTTQITSEEAAKAIEDFDDLDDDESEFSSEEDDNCSLSASKVPYVLKKQGTASTNSDDKILSPSQSNNTSLNTTQDTSATNDSQDMSQLDTDIEEDEDGVKEEKDDNGVALRTGVVGDKDQLKKQISEAAAGREGVEVEKRDRRRGKSHALTKEIVAVQPAPKMTSLKKKRAKIPQDPTALDWKLPIYTTQPFPSTKVPGEKKRRKREDPARFILQLKPSFEEGNCALDECVFEDARGTPISEFVTRKFTIRRILRSLCKHLWNPVSCGVLTNGRRRSLYESETFHKKLRERGASAALLGNAVEILATGYSLMDFVYIWFSDASEEMGLRLSQTSYRVATEPPKKLRLEHLPSMLHQQIQPVVQQILQKRLGNDTESTSIKPQPVITNEQPLPTLPVIPPAPLALPPPPPSTTTTTTTTQSTTPAPQPVSTAPLPPPTPIPTPAPPPTSAPPQIDSTMILAKMLQDDRLRSRMYNDPSLLFDLCCSLGLDKRGEEAKALSAPPVPSPATPAPPSLALISVAPTPTTPTPPTPSTPTPATPTPTTTTTSSTTTTQSTPASPPHTTVATPATPIPTTPPPASAAPSPPSTPMQSIPISPAQPVTITVPITTQPIVPIYATPTQPPHRTVEVSPVATQSTSSAPPTPKLDSPPPKLTITLAPKPAPSLTTLPSLSLPSSSITFPSNISATANTSLITTSALPVSSITGKVLKKRGRKSLAERKAAGEAVPTTKKYHKRSKPTPPTSPPNPSSSDSSFVEVKQEENTDSTSSSSSSSSLPDAPAVTLATTPATPVTPVTPVTPTHDTSVNGGGKSVIDPGDLKYTVESIDLGRNEEEKITFVGTTKDGKRKRLKLTTKEIKATFPPETAQYYIDEVNKFREGSGNSSYRSVMRRKGQS